MNALTTGLPASLGTGGIIFAVVLASISFVYAIVKLRTPRPADENERTKLANEFVQQLLSDARSEREELRKTVTELKTDGAAKEATIDRLEELARSKDNRIRELESRQSHIVARLSAGYAITLADVLGPEAAKAVGLDPELEQTTIPNR